jgi:hypothetical protein
VCGRAARDRQVRARRDAGQARAKLWLRYESLGRS